MVFTGHSGKFGLAQGCRPEMFSLNLKYRKNLKNYWTNDLVCGNIIQVMRPVNLNGCISMRGSVW